MKDILNAGSSLPRIAMISTHGYVAAVDVLVLPYQRFSDHLVARHLLDAHLDTTSAERVRM